MKYSTVLLLLCVVLFSLNLTAQNSDHITTQKSIMASTAASKNHKTLMAALKAAEMEKILDQEGPFTIFAPSDGAFEKLSSERVATLLKPENKEELQAMVTAHIIVGNLSASKILKAMCRGEGLSLIHI